MILRSCDGCGTNIPEEKVANTPMAITIGATLGVERADGHACSVACFDKAMAKLVARMRPRFERLVASSAS